MNPLEQNRQAAGVPTGGRWATAARLEPSIDLGAEAQELDAIAEQLSDVASAELFPAAEVADFAARTRRFLTDRLGETPVTAQVPNQLDGQERGPVKFPLVTVDRGWRAADFTVNSRAALMQTLVMAERSARETCRAQTIDCPGDDTWLRTTVAPDGNVHTVPVSAPYWNWYAQLTQSTPADELVAAGLVLAGDNDTDAWGLARRAAAMVSGTNHDAAEGILAQMVTQNFQGKWGAVGDILAGTPQATPGYRELTAAFAAETDRKAAELNAMRERLQGRLG